MSPTTRELSDDEDLDAEPEVMLGFLEEPERPTSLLRHRFPSKVGGRPAWLDPVNLPPLDSITCPFTGKPLSFLLQVYAPLDDRPDAFHRAVFLFISEEGDRLGQPGTVRAFRCQLQRQNPFYSDKPPKDRDLVPQALRASDYESSLQRDPWRVAEAERAATRQGERAASSDSGSDATSCKTFPEFELIVEPEGSGGEEDDEEGEEAVQRSLEEYHQRVAAEGELDDEELPEEVVQQVEAAMDPERQNFADFQATIAPEPDQCIRYCFNPNAQPLWPSLAHRPSPEDIPPCPHCGCSRQFEFQVLPQLINSMEVDDLDPRAPDWGTIVVYSCSKSCTIDIAAAGTAYAEEFCWVQPP